MDVKGRRLIARIKPLHTLARWLAYHSTYFYYKRMEHEHHYNEIWDKLKGSKKGEKCFIIGNGPSLTVSDLEKLTGYDCFAVNGIYNVFPQTKWRPKYYLLIDRYICTPEKVRDVDAEYVFLSDYYCKYNPVLRKDFICMHNIYHLSQKNMFFSEDMKKGFSPCATVTYTAMQIAAYMGYSEVYLLGIDHSYRYEFDKTGKIVKNNVANTHFYHDASPRDFVADSAANERAYRTFKKYAEEHGITVKNATRGGKLEVFERVDLDELLAQK